MTAKTDFTIDEWDLLRSSPLMASLLVVSASPSGPIGLIEESTAAGNQIREASTQAQTPLLKTLAEDMLQTMSLPKPPQGSTAEQVRAATAEILRRTSALLKEKATEEEALEIKHWLASVAQATAEASKEGGFLGIGGTLVSDEEKTALQIVHEALGV